MREIRLEINVSAHASRRSGTDRQYTDQEIAEAIKKLINHEISYDDPVITSIDADSVKVVAK